MYGVVVPVKPPALAKSRLAGLGDELRRRFCAAFALDTVSAVSECSAVQAVLVVTDDVSMAEAFAALGVHVIPDGVGGDLNTSLRLGAAELLRRVPGVGVAAVFADLPALRSHELLQALEEAPTGVMSFVADADGVGSTSVVAPSLDLFLPRFGPASRAEHLRTGAYEITAEVPGLRRDVDTPQDLTAALELGAGSRTRFVATSFMAG